MTPLLLLAEKVEGLGALGDNALDVQVEIALFEPYGIFTSVRANAAGTKVIYTVGDGKEVTHWAADWTVKDQRDETVRLLRLEARAAMEAGE